MIGALILLTTLAVAAGEGPGHNQVLNFPYPANVDNYLSFEAGISEPLTGVTVCAWIRKSSTDSQRYWFSYAVSGSHNEIIVGEHGTGEVSFYVRGTRILVASDVLPLNQWTHVCTTWDSASGDSAIYTNGEVRESGVNKQGETITAGGSLVLGQEQDSVGGAFDATQCFLGQLYGINVWDYALPADEIGFLFSTGRCGYGEAEQDPIIPYSGIVSLDPRGTASIVNGSCIDLEDPSVGEVLRFPLQSSTGNYIQFAPELGSEAFEAVSVCTWYFKTFSDTSRYFFSYAHTDNFNGIILGESSNKLGMWIMGSKYLADVNLEQNRWYHVCGTWAADSVVSLYVDGEKVGDSPVSTVALLPVGGMLNIGQEQDSFGGSFDASQAYSGSLYNLNMFKIKLSDEDVARIYGGGTFCEMVPDDFWTNETIAISYNTIINQPRTGNVALDVHEEAWRHGAKYCKQKDTDDEAHTNDCWVEEEGRRYKDKSTAGTVMVLDVDSAKAACFATKTCKAITCEGAKGGALKCALKESFKRAKKSNKHISYTYRC